MFVADLFFMTPEGVILARPASTVRAGEERWVAERLAGLGIPILGTLRGGALFEGADAIWLDAAHVLLGRGFRTNDEGARQVAAILAGMGVDVTRVELPPGAMHLMGAIRFLDDGLAVMRSDTALPEAESVLKRHGFRVLSAPVSEEVTKGVALNFVTLGPRRILMSRGNPATQAFLEDAGVFCRPIAVDELAKGAGGIGCLTGIIQRGGLPV
jgi:N-dimethylarginine dimethylaminohydrolase